MSQHPLVKMMWVTPEAEHLITDMARVSAPKNQGNYDTASRLIGYLICNRHWSPFEMASMCVEINTTRDITAQIIRHRSFSFQEFSQRYADVKDLGKLQVPELRRQDTKNRQNSIPDLDPATVADFKGVIEDHFDVTQIIYDDMLEAGIAKECARKVLPMNSPSRIYMTGTLRSWMHYIDLRASNGTQKEHMDIAKACEDIFKKQFPSIHKAMKESKSTKNIVKNLPLEEVLEAYNFEDIIQWVNKKTLENSKVSENKKSLMSKIRDFTDLFNI
jgi:thymidylate synthase (FAD)